MLNNKHIRGPFTTCRIPAYIHLRKIHSTKIKLYKKISVSHEHFFLLVLLSFVYITFTNKEISLLFPISSFCNYCGSAGKDSACNAGDLGLIPGLGRFPGERKVYPLQYSSLENSMDSTVHGASKNRTRLSDYHFHFHV